MKNNRLTCKKTLLLILISLPLISFSQDTVILTNGEEISVKITTVSSQNVEYKKFSNLEGPTYILDKKEIFLIKYKNGEKEVFSQKKPTINGSDYNNADEFKRLTKRNNIIYIESIDDGELQHAKRHIQNWGFFRMTINKEEADLILRFIGQYNGAAHWSTYLQFINPDNEEIIKTTQRHHDVWGWDFNSKRGAVKKLINRELKPFCY